MPCCKIHEACNACMLPHSIFNYLCDYFLKDYTGYIASLCIMQTDIFRCLPCGDLFEYAIRRSLIQLESFGPQGASSQLHGLPSGCEYTMTFLARTWKEIDILSSSDISDGCRVLADLMIIWCSKGALRSSEEYPSIPSPWVLTLQRCFFWFVWSVLISWSQVKQPILIYSIARFPARSFKCRAGPYSIRQ